MCCLCRGSSPTTCQLQSPVQVSLVQWRTVLCTAEYPTTAVTTGHNTSMEGTVLHCTATLHHPVYWPAQWCTLLYCLDQSLFQALERPSWELEWPGGWHLWSYTALHCTALHCTVVSMIPRQAEMGGLSGQEAAEEALAYMEERVGGQGGVIVVDRLVLAYMEGGGSLWWWA